jgi:hypothetical protein
VIYEYYRSGACIERVEPSDLASLEATRIQVAVLERGESGALDGWYEAGTYHQPADGPATILGGSVDLYGPPFERLAGEDGGPPEPTTDPAEGES